MWGEVKGGRMKTNKDEVKKVEGGEERKVKDVLDEGHQCVSEEVSGLPKRSDVCTNNMEK